MFKNICRPTNWIRKTTSPTTITNSSSSTASRTHEVSTITKQTLAGPLSRGTARHDVRYLTTANVQQQQQERVPTRQQQQQNQLLKRTPDTLFTSIARTMASNTTTKAEMGQEISKHTNRLSNEKSPYLLQHAHNPVDWYPWGEEAIEKARREDKLIFLSVGYSTCHWCHVMEHESFEKVDVAEIMNKYFVNVKVDREERPDIDQIYMRYLLSVGRGGGWPMSVWITPELTPVMAGTYFPPVKRWGMPSFKDVLSLVARLWQSNRAEMCASGQQVIDAMKRSMEQMSDEAPFAEGSADARLQEALNIYKQRIDETYGGFGAKPKFPEVSRLNFLFHAFIVTKDIDVLDMVLRTLRNIGLGGIHDHVFGGFARYAVDRKWHIPHFEKMLYDQGQLLAAFSNAYKLTRENNFLSYADGIFEYIMKDLRHPLGGFYSGEDADSLPTAEATRKVEGAFYAWTWEEIRNAILKNPDLYEDVNVDKAFEVYCQYYDVREQGNVSPEDDPHDHLTYKNILIVRVTTEDLTSKYDITADQLQHIVKVTNESLHKLRQLRPRPHLDTKIICSWNGLVLSGLSKLANCGSAKREEYLKAASELVQFMHKHMYDEETKTLLRSRYGYATDNDALAPLTEGRIDGFLDDYAFLVRGLLDYYKASLDGWALQWAKELQDTQDRLFWDSDDGAYFYSMANSPNVIMRLKDENDGAEPCGNSVASRNLILLAHYFDDESYKKRSEELFQFFSGVKHLGHALPEMTSSLMLHEFGLDLVAVVGPHSEETERFVEICRRYFIPGMIILHVDPQHPDKAYNMRIQEKFKMINDKPTVYICHDKVCRMPVTDPVKLEEHLKENFFNITEL